MAIRAFPAWSTTLTPTNPGLSMETSRGPTPLVCRHAAGSQRDIRSLRQCRRQNDPELGRGVRLGLERGQLPRSNRLEAAATDRGARLSLRGMPGASFSGPPGVAVLQRPRASRGRFGGELLHPRRRAILERAALPRLVLPSSQPTGPGASFGLLGRAAMHAFQRTFLRRRHGVELQLRRWLSGNGLRGE